MHRNAARAVCVRHGKASAVQTISPRSPAHRFSQALIDIILQLHAGDVPKHDRRNVRGGRGVGIAGTCVRPQNGADRGSVQVVNVLAGSRLEWDDLAMHDAGLVPSPW